MKKHNYKNDEIIKKLKYAIKILQKDLKTYGVKNKTVAEYDKKQINKYEAEIENLKRKMEENKNEI